MGRIKGQKVKEVTRDINYKIRLSLTESKMLEKIAKRDKVSKAEVIRKGIELQK